MNNRIQLTAAALVALALTAITLPAHASTWLLNYIVNAGGPAPFEASLTVVASNTANALGSYDVTAILGGQVDGDAITGLTPNSNAPNAMISGDGKFIFDNNVSPFVAPWVSSPGLLFTSATAEYNLFSNSATDYELLKVQGGNYVADSRGTLSVTSVPEPASWALMIVGFGLAGATMRARRRLQPVRAAA
jgi:hypothetical protein